ncbi:phage holin family protein [Timonella sp. A28]|uniref:phage holin family protein n=1 Tax=Timonella sp. A28 TaxID=3442640 RepID=UPI003EB8DD16
MLASPVLLPGLYSFLRLGCTVIRFLLHILVSLVSAALAFFVASLIIDGFEVQAGGFLIAIAVFTASQALFGPFVFNLARKYASAILGGIGLVSTVLALWVATLFSGGITIDGVTAWIASTLVVWLITALGVWLLGLLVIKRWWGGREEEKARLKTLSRQDK